MQHVIHIVMRQVYVNCLAWQNDIVLLSLVRTKTVGHLRDVRRLVVALSRARLGLYVFCRAEVFVNCFELRPAFAQMMERPDKLTLV
jgi:intron-binding protein aquarius